MEIKLAELALHSALSDIMTQIPKELGAGSEFQVWLQKLEGNTQKRPKGMIVSSLFEDLDDETLRKTINEFSGSRAQEMRSAIEIFGHSAPLIDHSQIKNVAKAVLNVCMQEASHGRSLASLNLDNVISTVIGDKPKGITVSNELVDSLLNLVSELDIHETPQMDAFHEYGTETALGKAKALLHQAGYEWAGKDVGHCNNLVSDLCEKSLIQATTIASTKADYVLASQSLRHTFEGMILGVTDLHTVQSIGRTAIIHENQNLDRIPEKDEMVNITYLDTRSNKLGKVESLELNKGQGLGR